MNNKQYLCQNTYRSCFSQCKRTKKFMKLADLTSNLTNSSSGCNKQAAGLLFRELNCQELNMYKVNQK